MNHSSAKLNRNLHSYHHFTAAIYHLRALSSSVIFPQFLTCLFGPCRLHRSYPRYMQLISFCPLIMLAFPSAFPRSTPIIFYIQATCRSVPKSPHLISASLSPPSGILGVFLILPITTLYTHCLLGFSPHPSLPNICDQFTRIFTPSPY